MTVAGSIFCAARGTRKHGPILGGFRCHLIFAAGDAIKMKQRVCQFEWWGTLAAAALSSVHERTTLSDYCLTIGHLGGLVRALSSSRWGPSDALTAEESPNSINSSSIFVQ